MATFAYKAYDGRGKVVSGEETAADKESLTAALSSRGLFLFQSKVSAGGPKQVYQGRVPQREIIHFTEQLTIIVRSGIPILAGLEEIRGECRHPGLQAVIGDIARRISDGSTLSQALAAYPRIFDDAYQNVAAAGEETGSLDAALEKMSEQMSWVLDTKRQVRGAMIQPAILLLAVSGLTVLVVAVLVPKITEMFNRNSLELPGITAALVAVSEFLRGWWPYLIGGGVGLFMASRIALGLGFGRRALDAFKLKIPVIGHVISLFAASRFANLFSLLNEAGVAVVRNLEIVQKATGNAIYNDGVAEMRDVVIRGGSISDGISSTQVFPSLVVRMLRIGEQTGEIPQAMDRICTYYDSEIPRALKKITTVLQPVLMLVSAAVVAFVVFAAFMPIVKLVQGAH